MVKKGSTTMTQQNFMIVPMNCVKSGLQDENMMVHKNILVNQAVNITFPYRSRLQWRVAHGLTKENFLRTLPSVPAVIASGNP